MHTISPTSPLPGITDVIIDGLTQPGTSNATWPPDLRIELRGSNDPQHLGLSVGDNYLIRGLVINRFFAGVSLDGNNNQLKCNFIGTDPSGIFDRGNGLEGIKVYGNTNVIGGATPAERNLISGNGRHGIAIALGHGNLVFGNYIGTNAFGTGPMGNHNHGIDIFNSADNQIGGTTPAARNIISGNGNGITIFDLDATSNVIQGNYIGTDATGTFAVGNISNGIMFRGSPGGNLIGGTTGAARNIISGNATGISFGTVFDSSSNPIGNLVQGNYLGLSATGSPLGNTADGVFIRDYSHNNFIGGTTTGAGNTIAYNGNGIHISRTPLSGGASAIPTGNSILGNSIFANSKMKLLRSKLRGIERIRKGKGGAASCAELPDPPRIKWLGAGHRPQSGRCGGRRWRHPK